MARWEGELEALYEPVWKACQNIPRGEKNLQGARAHTGTETGDGRRVACVWDVPFLLTPWHDLNLVLFECSI